MDGHFRAFSFVDRILALEPGVRIHGHYAIPAAVSAFPASLVAEATGQLAAWAAMSAIGFSHRPVAGIAGRIDLASEARPGQVLELVAEIESVDTETVAYSGTAQADGVPILRLHDCVGPMVPIEEFDDPQALRERFHLLRTVGATPGAFAGLPALDLEACPGESGELARSRLRVPTEAPFFSDHFPRRPVFPGTVLMHANLLTAARLAATVPIDPGRSWVPRVVSEVKLRTFIAPGESLELEAKRAGWSGAALQVIVESRARRRLIGSARIEFAPEAVS